MKFTDLRRDRLDGHDARIHRPGEPDTPVFGADTGAGIARNKQETIFEAVEQADGSRPGERAGLAWDSQFARNWWR